MTKIFGKNNVQNIDAHTRSYKPCSCCFMLAYKRLQNLENDILKNVRISHVFFRDILDITWKMGRISLGRVGYQINKDHVVPLNCL